MLKYFYNRIKKDFNRNEELKFFLIVIGGIALFVFFFFLNIEIMYLIGFDQKNATFLGTFALLLEPILFFICKYLYGIYKDYIQDKEQQEIEELYQKAQNALDNILDRKEIQK